MANEGFLGRTKIEGERAATDDHPVIIHALPLEISVSGEIAVGTLMKKVEVLESELLIAYDYAPWLESDATLPCAVVDKPCDIENGEKSAICVVHGCVKAHILKVQDGIVNNIIIEKLKQSGIFAV